MKLADYFEDHYQPEVLFDAVPGTVEQYAATLSTFRQYLGREPKLADLTSKRMAQYLAARREYCSPVTCNGDRTHLLAIARHAHPDHLAELPKVKALKTPKREPEAWTMEQFALILAAATKLTGTVRADGFRVKASEYFTALLLVLYDTGGRINAVMLTTRDKLNTKRRLWTLDAALQKQKADQTKKLHGDTIKALGPLLAKRNGAGDEPVFLWPYDTDGKWRCLTRRLRKILELAGLPHGRRDLWHKMRRTSCTQVAVVAGEIAAGRHMGHGSLGMTARYIDRTQLKADDAADIMPRPPKKRLPRRKPRAK